MSALSCQAFFVLHNVILLYTIVMLIYAVLSWVPDLRGGWSRWIEMLVEPVLAPVRRLIPPMGGFDWSFLIVIVLLQMTDRLLVQPNAFACY